MNIIQIFRLANIAEWELKKMAEFTKGFSGKVISVVNTKGGKFRSKIF